MTKPASDGKPPATRRHMRRYENRIRYRDHDHEDMPSVPDRCPCCREELQCDKCGDPIHPPKHVPGPWDNTWDEGTPAPCACDRLECERCLCRRCESVSVRAQRVRHTMYVGTEVVVAEEPICNYCLHMLDPEP